MAQSAGVILCSVAGDDLPDLVGGEGVWPERWGAKARVSDSAAISFQNSFRI